MKTSFLMTILIKLTLGNIFIKVKKICQGDATVKKQLIYFSNAAVKMSADYRVPANYARSSAFFGMALGFLEGELRFLWGSLGKLGVPCG